MYLSRLSLVSLALGLTASILHNGADAFRVLHVSDPHYDDHYREGKAVTCVLQWTGLGCCRTSTVPWPLFNYEKAGPIGEYSCDASPQLIKEGIHGFIDYFEHGPGKNEEAPSVLLMTGDNASHEDHLQTPSLNLDATEQVVNIIETKIRKSERFKDAIFLPTLGNHDGWPVNQLSHISAMNKWLLNPLAKVWPDIVIAGGGPERWGFDPAEVESNIDTAADLAALLEKEKQRIAESIKDGGYYTVQVKPGLHAMILNMLFFSDRNIFLPKWDKDPAKHKSWMRDEVKRIAEMGDRIWIVTHFGNGDAGDATQEFTAWFQSAILDQYPGVVVSHFLGHTHRDELTLDRYSFADHIPRSDQGVAAAVHWIGPSLAPDGHYPALRIYDIDEETYVPSDFSVYAFDLQEANRRYIEARKKDFPSTPGYPVAEFAHRFTFSDFAKQLVITDDVAPERVTLMQQYLNGEIPLTPQVVETFAILCLEDVNFDLAVNYIRTASLLHKPPEKPITEGDIKYYFAKVVNVKRLAMFLQNTHIFGPTKEIKKTANLLHTANPNHPSYESLHQLIDSMMEAYSTGEMSHFELHQTIEALLSSPLPVSIEARLKGILENHTSGTDDTVLASAGEADETDLVEAARLSNVVMPTENEINILADMLAQDPTKFLDNFSQIIRSQVPDDFSPDTAEENAVFLS